MLGMYHIGILASHLHVTRLAMQCFETTFSSNIDLISFKVLCCASV